MILPLPFLPLTSLPDLPYSSRHAREQLPSPPPPVLRLLHTERRLQQYTAQPPQLQPQLQPRSWRRVQQQLLPDPGVSSYSYCTTSSSGECAPCAQIPYYGDPCAVRGSVSEVEGGGPGSGQGLAQGAALVWQGARACRGVRVRLLMGMGNVAAASWQ